MLDILTAEVAREHLVAAIDKRGADYTYPESEKLAGGMCAYLAYDEAGQPTGPSCIVGDMLVQLGVEPQHIAPLEGKSADTVLRRLEIEYEHGVDFALAEAQMAQDEGKPWGKALDAFDQALAGLRDLELV